MKKADMLEGIICELGLMKKETVDSREWYRYVIRVLKDKIPHYSLVTIYLADEKSFNYFDHVGDIDVLEEKINFGDGFISLVAARGDISCEFEPDGQKIFIPFYNGHFLIGEIIVKTTQFVDVDEIKFLNYIQNILS